MLFSYVTCSTALQTITNKKHISDICFYKLFLTLFRIMYQIVKNIVYELICGLIELLID